MTVDHAHSDDPVRVRKLGEKIAERIVADIIARGWPVGQNLGTEKELLAQYGIARATFREAIRQVERHGAATMRRGAGGGLIVLDRPRASAAVRAMLSFLEITHVSFADQHEAREQLEVAAARLAAERIDEAKVAEIRGVIRTLESETDYVKNVAGNMRVRVAIGEATGNPILPLFIEVLNGVMREILRVLRVDEAAFHKDRTQSVEFKRRLVDAVAHRDAAEAERLVLDDARRRLLAMTSALTTPAPTEKTIDHAAQLSAWWEADQPPLKLSDQVVYRMVNDIAKLGWKEGHNLGKEAELQPRYGVSRAVLREAIRQLELHGIARMKTGMQGGLVISHIDPTYTVELVATYLRSTSANFIDYWETQSCLAVFAVGRLTQMASAKNCEELRILMQSVRKTTPETFMSTANTLHWAFADQTGNRSLSLFARVITRSSGELCPAVSERAMPRLIAMHESIVDAICARDYDGARARTAELFSRTRKWIVSAAESADKA